MSARTPWTFLGIALLSSAVTAGVMMFYWPGRSPVTQAVNRGRDSRAPQPGGRWQLAPTRVAEDLQPVVIDDWSPQPMAVPTATGGRDTVNAARGIGPAPGGSRVPQLEHVLQPMLFKSPQAWLGHPGGSVRLRTLIDERGVVRNIEVLGSAPRLLARKLVDALSLVRFGPARSGDVVTAIERDFEISLLPEQRRVEVLWLASRRKLDPEDSRSSNLPVASSRTAPRTATGKAAAARRRLTKQVAERSPKDVKSPVPVYFLPAPGAPPVKVVRPTEPLVEPPAETTPEPPADCLRVFVTRETFRGDFRLPDVPPGDLSAVDAHCRRAAEDAGLNRDASWTAWMSTSGQAAIERIDADGPWCVQAKEDQAADGHVDSSDPGGELVAFADPAKLKESPAVALDRDQFGEPLFYALYWTGSDEDGQPGDDNCRRWTSIEGRAGLGLTAARDRTWNRVGLGGCAEMHHLLCFEQ